MCVCVCVFVCVCVLEKWTLIIPGLQLIPLGSILHFVRMAISYDQREVLELLLNRSMNIADTRLSESEVHRQYVCIQLLLLVEAVRGASGGRRVTLQGVDNSQHGRVNNHLSTGGCIY